MHKELVWISSQQQKASACSNIHMTLQKYPLTDLSTAAVVRIFQCKGSRTTFRNFNVSHGQLINWQISEE